MRAAPLPLPAAPRIPGTSSPPSRSYLAGEDVLHLAADVDFPPCMLLRRMLERLIDASKQVQCSLCGACLPVGLTQPPHCPPRSFNPNPHGALPLPDLLCCQRAAACHHLPPQAVGELLRHPSRLDGLLPDAPADLLHRIKVGAVGVPHALRSWPSPVPRPSTSYHHLPPRHPAGGPGALRARGLLLLAAQRRGQAGAAWR